MQPHPFERECPQRPDPPRRRWSFAALRSVLDGSAPDHRLPGTVFAFRSSSVTAALRYGRLHSTRRNADRSRLPLMPPTRSLSAPCDTPCREVWKAPHHSRCSPRSRHTSFVGHPRPASRHRLSLRHSVSCLTPCRAVSHSPPPILHHSVMRYYPAPCAFFIVSRSSSGLLEAPHPAATCRASTEKWVSQREPSFPSAFFLRTPGSLLLLARRHFFSRKNGFSSSFFLSTTSESTPVKTWRGFHMRSEA